jgi:hypothetical protein
MVNYPKNSTRSVPLSDRLIVQLLDSHNFFADLG